MVVGTGSGHPARPECGPWRFPAPRGPWGWVAANAALAAVYFALGLVVSRFFAAYGIFPSPIWLPASIAVVAAMVGRFRMLPGIFAGSFAANAILFEASLGVATIVSAANALGPVVAVAVLRRCRCSERLFTSAAGVSAFLICTILVHPAITATGGALALGLGRPLDLGQSYVVWVGWWLSDAGGTLYLAPALILWLGLESDSEGGAVMRQALGRRDFAIWALVALGGLALFLTPTLHAGDLRSAFAFLLVVPLSWIALRMSLRDAYTLVSLVAVVATAGTVAGVGPFQFPGLANKLEPVGTLVVLLAMNVLTIVALVSERDEAQKARKVKAMFLAKTSHELRTPLNAIIGFSSLIDQQALGPLPNKAYMDYARLIQSSGEHLLALINDLLEMSKIEAGRIDLHDERIDLAAAVEGAAALVAGQARAKSIALDIGAADAEIVVEADAKALRQILLNLLSNAVKFTPEGGRIAVETAQGGGGEVVVRVTDSGIGIPADAQSRLFTPFERAHRDASQPIEGTGLGLAITKGLVLLHGGTIDLASDEGRGTTVTVTLPAARVVHAARRTVRPADQIAAE
ncbi:MAG: ATP-binding protein [Rhodospirillales bacterium]